MRAPGKLCYGWRVRRKKPDVIDAKYEVIDPPRQRWWQGWYFDWRAGLWGGLIAGAIAWLTFGK